MVTIFLSGLGRSLVPVVSYVTNVYKSQTATHDLWSKSALENKIANFYLKKICFLLPFNINHLKLVDKKAVLYPFVKIKLMLFWSV